MKKLLSMAALLGFVLAVHAQELNYTFKAGVNLANIKSNRPDVDPKINLGFHVSGLVGVPLSSEITLQPGLTLQNKGFKVISYEDGQRIDGYSTVMSIDLPVNMLYSFPLASNSIFLGAGPYVGYNISGKLKGSMVVEGITSTDSENIDFGPNGIMKTFDFGLNFMTGFKLQNGVSINAGYGLGLSNQSHTSSTLKNAIWSFGLGYTL